MSWRDAIARAVLGGKVGGVHPGGIHTYHSSPHDFDKFDWSKLRSGEGANVYGAGFYSAESPKVSGQGGEYWNSFLGRFNPAERSAATVLRQSGFDKDAALKALDAEIEDYAGLVKAGAKQWQSDVDELKQARWLLNESITPIGPRTYELNLRVKPEELLDWDKPLMQQSPVLKERIAPLVRPEGGGGAFTGERIYSDLINQSGMSAAEARASQVMRSEMMRDAGIPGIRYLDQGSRISSPDQIKAIRENIAQREALLADNPTDPTNLKWLGEYQDMLKRATNPTYNYVMFDPSKIDIMAKYGVGGAAAIPPVLGAFADQSTYEVRP